MKELTDAWAVFWEEWKADESHQIPSYGGIWKPSFFDFMNWINKRP